jgi:uncharacterized protein (DUF433 family)
MNWKDYIISDQNVLAGKPVIKGTRLSVDFILDLLSNGWTEEHVLNNYKSLTRESLQAIYSFALDCMRDEKVYDVPKSLAI